MIFAPPPSVLYSRHPKAEVEMYKQGYRQGIETAMRIVEDNKKKVKESSEDLDIEEGIDYLEYCILFDLNKEKLSEHSPD